MQSLPWPPQILVGHVYTGTALPKPEQIIAFLREMGGIEILGVGLGGLQDHCLLLDAELLRITNTLLFQLCRDFYLLSVLALYLHRLSH